MQFVVVVCCVNHGSFVLLPSAPCPLSLCVFVCLQVAKAQLDEDMCVEAIASYIKAEDPSYYAEVTTNKKTTENKKKKQQKNKNDSLELVFMLPSVTGMCVCTGVMFSVVFRLLLVGRLAAWRREGVA